MKREMAEKICTVIAEFRPFSPSHVYSIYMTQQSIDKTILIIDASMATATEPVALAISINSNTLKTNTTIK